MAQFAGFCVAKLSSGGFTLYFQNYISYHRIFILIGPYDYKGGNGKTLLQAGKMDMTTKMTHGS
jgi:hypothetical protein